MSTQVKCYLDNELALCFIINKKDIKIIFDTNEYGNLIHDVAEQIINQKSHHELNLFISSLFGLRVEINNLPDNGTEVNEYMTKLLSEYTESFLHNNYPSILRRNTVNNKFSFLKFVADISINTPEYFEYKYGGEFPEELFYINIPIEKKKQKKNKNTLFFKLMKGFTEDHHVDLLSINKYKIVKKKSGQSEENRILEEKDLNITEFFELIVEPVINDINVIYSDLIMRNMGNENNKGINIFDKHCDAFRFIPGNSINLLEKFSLKMHDQSFSWPKETRFELHSSDINFQFIPNALSLGSVYSRPEDFYTSSGQSLGSFPTKYLYLYGRVGKEFDFLDPLNIREELKQFNIREKKEEEKSFFIDNFNTKEVTYYIDNNESSIELEDNFITFLNIPSYRLFNDIHQYLKIFRSMIQKINEEINNSFELSDKKKIENAQKTLKKIFNTQYIKASKEEKVLYFEKLEEEAKSYLKKLFTEEFLIDRFLQNKKIYTKVFSANLMASNTTNIDADYVSINNAIKAIIPNYQKKIKYNAIDRLERSSEDREDVLIKVVFRAKYLYKKIETIRSLLFEAQKEYERSGIYNAKSKQHMDNALEILNSELANMFREVYEVYPEIEDFFKNGNELYLYLIDIINIDKDDLIFKDVQMLLGRNKVSLRNILVDSIKGDKK